jgi:hypothetical protein
MFQVIELRRYITKEGAREHFARCFDTLFPEAFQQLGALACGQFCERANPAGFTWLRGFKDFDARAIVNSAIYYGPVWKEHRSTMNDRLIDSDNVLLLRPLAPGREVIVLPAVDPVAETPGARGVVAAQVFAVEAGRVDALAERAEAAFVAYRSVGVREAGVLVTLDGPNNFPQHPIRTDGPFLVWLGVMKDDETLDGRFQALVEESSRSLASSGLLRGAPELVVLDPTPRSRLRWLPEWSE